MNLAVLADAFIQAIRDDVSEEDQRVTYTFRRGEPDRCTVMYSTGKGMGSSSRRIGDVRFIINGGGAISDFEPNANAPYEPVRIFVEVFEGLRNAATR